MAKAELTVTITVKQSLFYCLKLWILRRCGKVDVVVSTDKEYTIDDFETVELVQELSRREGVDRYEVDHDGVMALEIQNPGQPAYQTGDMGGPRILLDVID